MFYTERGDESSIRVYDNEADACADLFSRVVADEHNRFELVAGPAPSEQADRDFDTWLRAHSITRNDLAPGDYRTDEVPWKAGEPYYRRYFVRIKRARAAS